MPGLSDIRDTPERQTPSTRRPIRQVAVESHATTYKTHFPSYSMFLSNSKCSGRLRTSTFTD
eukprot:365325-Chlamydomonas_euryale.AAC.9